MIYGIIGIICLVLGEHILFGTLSYLSIKCKEPPAETEKELKKQIYIVLRDTILGFLLLAISVMLFIKFL